MHVIVTGANGFIGRSLVEHLKAVYAGKVIVLPFTRESSLEELEQYIKKASFIFHFAGENRPKDVGAFSKNNVQLTHALCEICAKHNPIPILFTSSTQALLDNPYGNSKLAGEEIIKTYAAAVGLGCYIIRLPGVFGKWCRPNYTSVIATWCYNILRDMPTVISNRDTPLPLVYIDDVIERFVEIFEKRNAHTPPPVSYIDIFPLYQKMLKDVHALLIAFKSARKNLIIPNLSDKFKRALYSTFLSYLPNSGFSSTLQVHSDVRGCFSEIFRFSGHGQVSVFTGAPGFTRGNHFHHSKVEKFILIQGQVKVNFRRVDYADVITYSLNADQKVVLDVPPGYIHNVENIGESDFIMLVWASELFDPTCADTYSQEV